MLAATARNLAALALTAVARRLLDLQRRLGILVRSARAALAYAVRRFRRGGHVSCSLSVLLISLVGGVLLDIALLTLLLRILGALLAVRRLIAGGLLVVTGSLRASVRWRNRRKLAGHCSSPLSLPRYACGP